MIFFQHLPSLPYSVSLIYSLTHSKTVQFSYLLTILSHTFTDLTIFLIPCFVHLAHSHSVIPQYIHSLTHYFTRSLVPSLITRPLILHLDIFPCLTQTLSSQILLTRACCHTLPHFLTSLHSPLLTILLLPSSCSPLPLSNRLNVLSDLCTTSKDTPWPCTLTLWPSLLPSSLDPFPRPPSHTPYLLPCLPPTCPELLHTFTRLCYKNKVFISMAKRLRVREKKRAEECEEGRTSRLEDGDTERGREKGLERQKQQWKKAIKTEMKD